MIFEQMPANPFEVQISFHIIIENLEQIAQSDVDYRADHAKSLLAQVEQVPELRTGMLNVAQIEAHKDLIQKLLAELFPVGLTKNDIKAVSIPFHNITFNHSERFQYILDSAGPDFNMVIRNFEDDHFYIMSCLLILNKNYGCHFEFSKPFFYDIPDLLGVMRHYRIMYNGDFIEILPTASAISITQQDIDLLTDNFHDIGLWKAKFPPNSYTLRGFCIMTLYDATTESAVSNLKSTLITKPDDPDTMPQNFEPIFRSIFKIKDLRIGFTALNVDDQKFVGSPFNKMVPSFMLPGLDPKSADMLCYDTYYNILIKERKYFAISDLESYGKLPGQREFAQMLLDQDIKSIIFAPVIKNNKVFGVVEVVSSRIKELNSIAANKLDIVMPYLVDTIDRYYSDVQNQIDAMIQNEYTTIHPSVYWKFRDEATRHLTDTSEMAFNEISFSEVYPLYGQIDVQGSSDKRNASTRADLISQIKSLIKIFKAVHKAKPLPILEQKVFELEELLESIADNIKADSEQLLLTYIKKQIHPRLKQFKGLAPKVKLLVAAYLEQLDNDTGMVYDERRKFDTSLSIINRKMAAMLDKQQRAAQSYYPHYFERFKTDGVEHNIYIGNSITNQPKFDLLYLYNMRLWQLQVMCEMEQQYHLLKDKLPYPMEVTSLLLVFNHPITIRFRMDEKRFDVDGSYNARYEVVKKRIDKACIKGCDERIVKKDTITIVYTQESEATEYKKYISFLQHKKKLGPDVEYFEIEDLQGIVGLRGIRVNVLFNEKPNNKVFSYQELLEEVNS